MDIGKRVRDAREARGLTQEELARRAGVPLNRVGRIETGTVTDPHYSTLSHIADGLGLSVGELLEEGSVLAGKAEAPETAGPLAELLSDEERLRLIEKTVDILRHYHDLGQTMLARMQEDQEDLRLHGTATVWNTFWRRGLRASMEKDGTDEHAMMVETGKRKVSRREFAACDKLLEYDIKMHNLVVDMLSIDQANNVRVGWETERAMGEVAAYLEDVQKDVPRRWT